MTKQKHTSGPWQVHSDHNRTLVIGNIDGPDDGQYHFAKIAECDTESEMVLSDAECQANARLIAAAPDLLEALKLAINTVECASIDVKEGVHTGEELPWYSAARKAIRKVEDDSGVI